MLKLILTVVISIALVSAGFLAVQRHQEYQTQKQHEAAIAQTAASEAQAKEKATAQADRAKLVTSYNQLRVECEKGLAAKNALPANLQKTVPAPKCGPVLL